MKNILFSMSGGTTPVINSTLYGLIDEAKKSKLFQNIYISKYGIDGLIKHHFILLNNISSQKLKKLKFTPGSYFGISRNPKITDAIYSKIKKNLIKNNITHFVNIGGNGSLEQTLEFKKKINCIQQIAFAPKTVDNDLGDKDFKTVFFTPGFPTCINFWIRMLNLINIENIGAKEHDKVIVCQTFGRDTGHITAACRLFDLKNKMPLIYLIPEDQQDKKNVLRKIKLFIKKYGRAIVIIGEGYKIKDFNIYKDSFGQSMFGSSSSSASQQLVNFLIKNKIQSRAFMPTIIQRVSDFVYLKKDNEVAEKIGRNIIKEFKKNKSGFMCTLSRMKNKNFYFYNTVNLESCINFKRKLEKKYFLRNKFNVSKKYLDYLIDVKKFTKIPDTNFYNKNFFKL